VNLSDKVKKWRKNTKERIIKAMGGKCCCCGYDYCTSALDLHHLDPLKKEISFGAIRANPKSWKTIVEELRKCILVCCRCHREIHDKLRIIPEEHIVFDENFVVYKETRPKINCKICGKECSTINKTCSRQCLDKLREESIRKVNWNKIDLLELLKTKNITEISKDLDISWNAVKRRLNKIKKIEKERKNMNNFIKVYQIDKDVPTEIIISLITFPIDKIKVIESISDFKYPLGDIKLSRILVEDKEYSIIGTDSELRNLCESIDNDNFNNIVNSYLKNYSFLYERYKK
jgi:hypothetical protein